MRTLITVLLAMVIGPSAAAQTAVTLKPSVRLDPGAPVTLGDLARLDGPEAERLAGAVVEIRPRLSGDGSAVEVDVAAVRRALERVEGGVNWGRITINGTACQVRFDVEETVAPAAAAPDESAPTKAPEPFGPTVRSRIATELARLYEVGEDGLRLTFRPEDDAFLGTPATGRRVDVHPAASNSSARLPVQVYVYAGDRLAASKTVTVEVALRREVLLARNPIEEGRVVTPDDYARESRWVSPNTPPGATPESAAAGTVRRRINAGQVIDRDDIETPVVIKRGDDVMVHCLNGAVKVRVKARALASGREGDVIAFQLEGSKRPFTARVGGPGRAVMLTDGQAPTAVSR